MSTKKPEEKSSNSLSIRRIQKEYKAIALDPPEHVTACPKDESDLFHWFGSITGPPNSPYKNGTFFLDITFPERYPFSPPKIKFLTRIYHCNISKKGEICLDILKKNWSSVYTIDRVLLSIFSLLDDPNPDDPLDKDIAKEFRQDRKKHDQTARLWVEKYAR